MKIGRSNLSLFFSLIVRSKIMACVLLGSATISATVHATISGSVHGTVQATDEFCIQSLNVSGSLLSLDRPFRIRTLTETISDYFPCPIVNLQGVWLKTDAELIEKAFSLSRPGTRLEPKVNLGLHSFVEGIASRLGESADTTFSGRVLPFLTSSLPDWIGQRYIPAFFPKQGASLFKVKLPGLADLIVVNLQWNDSSVRQRLLQAVKLFRQLERQSLPTLSLVLTGSFYMKSDSIEYRLLSQVFGLKDAFLEVHRAYTPTDCTICPENPLASTDEPHLADYVFYKSDWFSPFWVEVLSKTDKGVVLSPHFGLKASFRLNQAFSNKDLDHPRQPFGDVSQEQKRETLDETINYLLDHSTEEIGDEISYLLNLRESLK